MTTQKTDTPIKKGAGGIVTFLCCLSVFLGAVLFFAAKWYVDVYGHLGFDSILYTLRSSLSGLQSGLVEAYLKDGLLPAVITAGAVCLLLFLRPRAKLVLALFQKIRISLYPLHRSAAIILSLLLSGLMILHAAINTQFLEYISNTVQTSAFYEEYYKSPADIQITFPEDKRNLIYIFMESMETSYLSQAQGGGVGQNLIPELYELAQKNTNFSHSTDIGGFSVTSGTSWTIAGMVAQTSGVPLKTPPGIDGNGYGQDGVFLPGLTTLGDILQEEGYYQALMVGSNASFGGRKQYYSGHGTDKVYDYYTAIEDGIIPSDHYVWWGMEDHYLYEYAKQELTEIAAKDQPFAFTMLTVDTHHIGGYKCELCEDAYAENYENVISCASRQVSAFIEWIQQQPFYENTAIVIAGDHCSMDAGYFARNTESDYTRHVYNCFINPAAEASNTRNRLFCAVDMFPTTLAAMGCTIEGDRLALGTNLFSDTPSLLEELGYDAFNSGSSRASDYYYNSFFFTD